MHIYCSKNVRTSFRKHDKTGRSGILPKRPFTNFEILGSLCKISKV